MQLPHGDDFDFSPVPRDSENNGNENSDSSEYSDDDVSKT